MTKNAFVAVVTGGSSGVGRATANYFAASGYDVAVIARGEQGIADTVKELERHGGNVIGISADVADPQQVSNAAQKIEEQLGPVAVWINCAMTTVLAPVEEMSADEYRRVTEVTYLGTVNGTRAALRYMQERNSGIIVQVGSALALRSIPLQSAYCGAKAAVRAFTDSLRCELLHQKSGVKVTMVQLPAVNTTQFNWARNKFHHRMQPVEPVYQPEVAAKAIYNAAVARMTPREVWLGKSTIMSVVGNMFFPGLLDRYMARNTWQGQLTDEVEAPMRDDYLFRPLESGHQARGRFDRIAREKAVSVDSRVMGVAAVALVGLALRGLCRRRR
ncbi:SDR family oxidoreductase [Franconibacter helveticus 513]|uniref:SDR family oxidoreductase n=1 Tax=Franconibacter helveticus TaxID=357240 RepID=UPI000465742E|nr:SDR family oxidoreductase [Franconibacter helveticus]MDU6924137.1 SDR family oxidoreductase [Franconibacter helveticus]